MPNNSTAAALLLGGDIIGQSIQHARITLTTTAVVETVVRFAVSANLTTVVSPPQENSAVTVDLIVFAVFVCTGGAAFVLILALGAAYMHHRLQEQKDIDHAVVKNYYAMLASSKGGRRGDRTWLVHKGAASTFVYVESDTEESTAYTDYGRDAEGDGAWSSSSSSSSDTDDMCVDYPLEVCSDATPETSDDDKCSDERAEPVN